ncbi:17-beta-hydroxysteroid dehydrogenase type 2 [Hemicordylus capensis]|uniref:17-beta-hydroxysteroid dehydrogenase type 2 n=1 Tax=Hemicordylus capensis TaxID=884348 RepID=UPI002303B803|nr:17-beta-hydroxysteroid dehydrogenase type 2 [Hemicordylus capensis]
MGTYFSGADNSLSVYLAVTVIFGIAIFYRNRRNRAAKEFPFFCGLFLLFVFEILCFAALPVSLGLALFSLACLIFCLCTRVPTMLPVDRKAVLITGTDCGIGHALAKYLDSLGFVVFAGVLDEKGPGAKQLRETCSERLSVLQLDITNSKQIKEAYLEVAQKLKNADLWGLINNAGILGFAGDGELLSMSTYKQCMDVNFFGPVEVAKTFLPLLRKSKGRLINICSMAGSIPMPRFAAYGASKAALSMFSGTLRQELSIWGIKVAVLYPSGFKTSIQGTPELWDKEEQTLLQNLTPDVKKDYGEDYILSLKLFLSHLPFLAEADLSPVLCDVLHALLAKSPHGFYTPGKNAYKYLLISCYFPLWFFDFCMRKMLNIPGIPRALRDKK